MSAHPTMRPSLEVQFEERLEGLRGILSDLGGVLVAFSGGVDSSLLLTVAADVLGERAAGVTARSATIPARELELASRFASECGVKHVFVEADELASPDFVRNPPERCYFCKRTRYEAFRKVADEFGLPWIADGSNASDEFDWRPGLRANEELGVRSPLREAGLVKEDVRALARGLGLSNWGKPSSPCLASRIPYGMMVTKEKLERIERAEECLRSRGLTEFRVRHHGELARLEVPLSEMHKVLQDREAIVADLKHLGFRYVALDIEGFRSGSLNEAIGKGKPE